MANVNRRSELCLPRLFSDYLIWAVSISMGINYVYSAIDIQLNAINYLSLVPLMTIDG